LIGTEQFGVLVSDDGGDHFEGSNAGFDHQQILALGVDANQPARMLAVIANAPDPVLATEDAGRTWSPIGSGLLPEQVLRVFAAPDGAWWVSLARGGLLRYDVEKKAWKQVEDVVNEPEAARARPSRSKGISGARLRLGVVSDMAFNSKEWYAATSAGLLISTDRGVTWTPKSVGPLPSLPVQSVRVSSNGDRIRLVSLGGLLFSDDGGHSWTWHDLPLNSGGAVTLHAEPGDENTLVATARSGLYISRDAGKTWGQAGAGLPSTPVQDFAAAGGIFVASMRTGGLYVSSDSGQSWDRIPGNLADGFLAAVAPASEPGVFFAASATEGIYRLQWPGSVSSNPGSPVRSRKDAAHEEAGSGN
jgi:photosystem II stability/assembly factor-like uncharacterized protein